MSKLRFFCLAALFVVPAAGFACGSSTMYGGPILGSGSPDGGGTGSSGGGTGSSGSGGGPPAAHATFPTITNHGVPGMTAPKIVAVTFNGDANASAIGSYLTSLGTTAWWQAVMKDYAVGAGTAQSVPVTATLQASYTDDPSGSLADGGVPTMPGFVVSTITGTAAMPAPDANTIYAFFLPASTSFEIQGASSCQEVGGYHNSTVVGGKTYIYAVIPECAGAKFANRSFPSEIDLLSFLSSHEISEAATDPTATLTQTTFVAGYYNDFVDDVTDDLAWNLISDGEVADFCVDQFGLKSYNDMTTEGTLTLQRIWSTSAATAGKNPCIPVPSGESYFNAAPAAGSDIFIVSAENTAMTMEVDAFGDTTSSWQLLALDGALAQGGSAALTMSFSGGAPEVQAGLQIGAIPGIGVSNGTKAQLSITLQATLTANNPFASGFLISHDGTSLVTATNNHYWPFAVTTSAVAKQIGLNASAPVGLLRGQRANRAGQWKGLRSGL